MNVFSERLKQLRNATGLNQSELGKKLNCQRTRIADLERGKTSPTPEDITILSKTFNVSSDYLLGLSDIATVDMDMKTIWKYTNLSEKAIHFLCSDAFKPYREITNLLLEEAQENMILLSKHGCTERTEELKQIEEDSKNIYDMLMHIDIYISNKIQAENINITSNGRLLTNKQMDKLWDLAPELTFADYFTVDTISNKDIIERVLLDRIENSLKNLKHKYTSKTGDSKCPQ